MLWHARRSTTVKVFMNSIGNIRDVDLMILLFVFTGESIAHYKATVSVASWSTETGLILMGFQLPYVL